jgi:hypothetical protein
MDNKKIIHLEGFLANGWDGGVEFEDNSYLSIAEEIARKINSMEIFYENSKNLPEDTCQTNYSLYLPKVSLQAYFSNKKTSLEEVIEKNILNTIGDLDIYTEWYGYSEWTIEGYDVVNFTIGNHNLEEILSSYNGKYAHIVLEILEQEE